MILEWRLGNSSPFFLGLIIYEVGYGIGVWIPLWMSWVVSHLLGFLMAPMCGLLFSGHPYSVLYILSQILGHLRVVAVSIENY